ncbi:MULTISPECIES: nitronate monooxygenase [unclassified Pseudomonas]|uniref:NAD(P)H-dependent flavin oxidoreductase n=1 Tax=unclassified Pseudomonas TaxID=196821 RepID=UPI0024471B92|nr:MULTISPECIES: nitronate monooxygenase [unclassified Pseudomonas]MDH0893578.1 nitronate monooxygenase [Pseudomonas sp. GD03875]MDH1065771.1 nitronate monooxygenase [Pseudomonas sp. GD03985]
MSSLSTLLGIQHPIIQAPMVGVSTPQLAAAVSEAGGLGSLGLGASSPAQARELIEQTRALTAKPFNLNLFCHAPANADAAREWAWLERLRPLFAEFDAEPPATLREIYPSFLADPDMLEVLLEQRPAVVSFHFGLPPRDWIERLRQVGIVLLACVTTPEEAQLAEAAGVDALVAQGVEAGGHRGVFAPERGDAAIGTLALVRLLAKRSRLPVIAAGGIMDGAGIRAAMALGAAGVQLGTAFVLCPESSANAAYRAALKGEKAGRTEITSNLSGRPARGLPNRLYGDLGAALPDYPICYDAAKALHAVASARGSHDFAAQWAGQGAPLVRELPASELVAVLVREMAEASRPSL